MYNFKKGKTKNTDNLYKSVDNNIKTTEEPANRPLTRQEILKRIGDGNEVGDYWAELGLTPDYRFAVVMEFDGRFNIYL